MFYLEAGGVTRPVDHVEFHPAEPAVDVYFTADVYETYVGRDYLRIRETLARARRLGAVRFARLGGRLHAKHQPAA